MNRYDFYPGDYLKDTLGLTMMQDGAYRRLMDHYYATEQPIPDSEKFRITRAFTEDEKRETDWVLFRFFRSEGSVWRHRQIEDHIERAMAKISIARKNGRKGGRPKKQLDPSFDGDEQKTNPVFSGLTQTEPNPKAKRKLPSPSPSEYSDPSDQSGQHAPENPGETQSVSERPPPRRTRRKPQMSIPADWTPVERHFAKAAERGVDCNLAAEKFRAHAESIDRKCVHWDRAFDNWLLNERGGPPRSGPGNRPQFDAFEFARQERERERDLVTPRDNPQSEARDPARAQQSTILGAIDT